MDGESLADGLSNCGSNDVPTNEVLLLLDSRRRQCGSHPCAAMKQITGGCLLVEDSDLSLDSDSANADSSQAPPSPHHRAENVWDHFSRRRCVEGDGSSSSLAAMSDGSVESLNGPVPSLVKASLSGPHFSDSGRSSPTSDYCSSSSVRRTPAAAKNGTISKRSSSNCQLVVDGGFWSSVHSFAKNRTAGEKPSSAPETRKPDRNSSRSKQNPPNDFLFNRLNVSGGQASARTADLSVEDPFQDGNSPGNFLPSSRKHIQPSSGSPAPRRPDPVSGSTGCGAGADVNHSSTTIVDPIVFRSVFQYIAERGCEIGRKIDGITMDSNSLFRAASKETYGTETFHRLWRVKIASHLRRFHKRYSSFHKGPPASFVSHMKKLQKVTTPASPCDVHAMATVLKRDIYLLKFQCGQYEWLKISPVFGKVFPNFITLFCVDDRNIKTITYYHRLVPINRNTVTHLVPPSACMQTEEFSTKN